MKQKAVLAAALAITATGCQLYRGAKIEPGTGPRQMWRWLRAGTPAAYRQLITTQASDEGFCYVAPTQPPWSGDTVKQAQFLKAHRAGWECFILGSGGFESCACQTDPVTIGFYAGQRDAKWYTGWLTWHHLTDRLERMRNAIQVAPTTDWQVLGPYWTEVYREASRRPRRRSNRSVTVASYPNPRMFLDGLVACHALERALFEHGFAPGDFSSCGSFGVSMSVASFHAAKARKVVAQTVREEGLRDIIRSW